MANTHLISENNRRKLREYAINGASLYNHYLMNKVFLILCEDGKEYTLRFFKTDFRHLTGISSNLTDDNFFEKCKSRQLDIGNISERQKYNWSTLNAKGKRIAQIHRIIYDNIPGALFLIDLKTNTRNYPIAIKNDNINTCIGFVDNNNKARSLRKYSNSNNADEQKKILLVIARKQNEQLYDELIYTSDIKTIHELNENILNSMSSNLYSKFLEALKLKK